VNKVKGWVAEASFFVRAPHRTMVIRLTAPEPANRRLFLVCIGCHRIELAHRWIVETLRVSPQHNSSLIIEDAKNGMCVRCDAARIFEADEYRRWLAADNTDVDLTPESGRQLLMRALES